MDASRTEIVAQLRQLNETTSRILTAMPQPQSKIMLVMGIAATVAGILGIIGIIDTIIKWITGG
jgi:hypothetical protein